MVKEFMELRRIQTDLEEVLDRFEHGVIAGIETPVDVETVEVKLEIPKSCKTCFINSTCEVECGSDVCLEFWNKIIDHHKNK